MKMIDIIYNEDCLKTMTREHLQNKVDVVLTSPPYNTSRKSKDIYNSRYDVYNDQMSNEEYINWTLKVFEGYDKVLKENGCVLYNLSYSSENTSLIWLTVAEIIKSTNFTTADCLVWKKKKAIPNNRSKNKLTRIVEYVFVFVRKSENKTFNTNKKVVSEVERTGQKNYQNIYNFFEAENTSKVSDLNAATFSVDFVNHLLDIYAPKEGIIYDSFSGTGTTCLACKQKGLNFIASEISLQQVSEAYKLLQAA